MKVVFGLGGGCGGETRLIRDIFALIRTVYEGDDGEMILINDICGLISDIFEQTMCRTYDTQKIRTNSSTMLTGLPFLSGNTTGHLFCSMAKSTLPFTHDAFKPFVCEVTRVL